MVNPLLLSFSRLQKVQNFAAKIITNTRKFDHITPVLQELRWLPVRYYLMYTVGVLTFKCVKGIAPSYLSDKILFMIATQEIQGVGERGWIKHQHLPFSVAVCSSLAHFLRQVQWWSVAMATRYDVISIRWSSHVWVKIHVFSTSFNSKSKFCG